jgi:hypothetical protein
VVVLPEVVLLPVAAPLPVTLPEAATVLLVDPEGIESSPPHACAAMSGKASKAKVK